MKQAITLVLMMGLLAGCSETTETTVPTPGPEEKQDSTATTDDTDTEDADTMTELSYLALGDSYTIGEAVDPTLRWPTLLSGRLTATGLPTAAPQYIARTGWTTDELMAAIERQQPDSTYDLVSLLIGVNNQYRGYPFAQFEQEFVQLLDAAVAFAQGNNGRVVVLSIPDYSVTPFGQSTGTEPSTIASEIDAYNDYKEKICQERGILYFYITDITRKAAEDASYVAGDGLHPSGKAYQEFAERIDGPIFERLSQLQTEGS